jgi:DMSO/TMAO reductase YedYZ molybdopterin-dependent catalytic subunit
MFWLSKPYRHATARPERLAIGGIVERPNFGLTFEDLAGLDATYQLDNVGAYATSARLPGAPMQGVRLAGIIELVHVDPEVLFLCATTRDGFRISVWKREVERLGIIAYARDGAPLAPDLGGPFRLLLPGFKDEARDVWDVGVIEFADKSGKDSRNERAFVPKHSSAPGDVQGGLARVVVDPLDARTLVSPPPT